MRKHFIPLFLLCMVMVGFTACKKANDVTATTQGINSLQEFDQIISEINTDATNLRTGNPQTITKIHLSDAAIQEMRKNIVFDEKGNFRGFTKNGLMRSELTTKEQLFLYEKITGNAIIMLNSNKVIIAATENNQDGLVRYYTTCDDYRPWDAYPCRSMKDATCVY